MPQFIGIATDTLMLRPLAPAELLALRESAEQFAAALDMASFKGPPDDHGVVEIAYGIVPAYRGRGYATEAAGGLVEYASKDARVRRIRAHTLPVRSASTSVLAKAGFELLGTVEDPEDGLVWRWERDADERLR